MYNSLKGKVVCCLNWKLIDKPRIYELNFFMWLINIKITLVRLTLPTSSNSNFQVCLFFFFFSLFFTTKWNVLNDNNNKHLFIINLVLTLYCQEFCINHNLWPVHIAALQEYTEREVTRNEIPFVSLANCFIRVWLISSFILLVDAVICQMHELVAQTLRGWGIPLEKFSL